MISPSYIFTLSHEKKGNKAKKSPLLRVRKEAVIINRLEGTLTVPPRLGAFVACQKMIAWCGWRGSNPLLGKTPCKPRHHRTSQNPAG